jgi:LiaI-LiaF-like transmembrane region
MSQNQPAFTARRAPSLFWPIVLIGVGIIWLLSNLGLLNVNGWALLVRLWPIIFIVIGLDILFARSGIWGAIASAILGLLVVGGVIALLFIAQNNPAWLSSTPSFVVFNDGTQLRSQSITDPLAGARAATVRLGFPGGEGSLYALGDSENLLEGTVT